jgi:hypothetical protein
MIWDFSQPFPPDPNAPPSPSDRASRPRPAIEAPAAAVQNGDALEHDQAQLRLIGPAGGAELPQRLRGGERAAADASAGPNAAHRAPTVSGHPAATGVIAGRRTHPPALDREPS